MDTPKEGSLAVGSLEVVVSILEVVVGNRVVAVGTLRVPMVDALRVHRVGFGAHGTSTIRASQRSHYGRCLLSETAPLLLALRRSSLAEGKARRIHLGPDNRFDLHQRSGIGRVRSGNQWGTFRKGFADRVGGWRAMRKTRRGRVYRSDPCPSLQTF